MKFALVYSVQQFTGLNFPEPGMEFLIPQLVHIQNRGVRVITLVTRSFCEYVGFTQHMV